MTSAVATAAATVDRWVPRSAATLAARTGVWTAERKEWRTAEKTVGALADTTVDQSAVR